MDHPLIERDALLERYVQGSLPQATEEELEEHVVDCAACQDDLVAIRGLARGVRQVASEEAARIATRKSSVARFRPAASPGAGPAAGRSTARRAWAAAAVLLVVTGLLAGYAVWLASENRALRATLAATSPADESGGAGTQTHPGTRVGAVTDDVRETDRIAALERSLPAAVGSVVLLSEVRGPSGSGEATRPAIDSSSLDGPFALAVYILDDPRFTSYRIQVIAADGTVTWQRSGLVPNAFEALMATFPPTFFPPGSYDLHVVGLTAEGDAVPLESYPFDVA